MVKFSGDGGLFAGWAPVAAHAPQAGLFAGSPAISLGPVPLVERDQGRPSFIAQITRGVRARYAQSSDW